MIFLSEYKKVTNSELASQRIARIFKAMGTIYCSCWEQPNWPKEDFRKVCSSPDAESISEGMSFADYSPCPSSQGQFETRWCLELFNEQEQSLCVHIWLWWLWLLDTAIWIMDVAWSRHRTLRTVATRQILNKESTDCLHWLRNLQFCKMEIWKIEWEEIQFWSSRKGIAKELICF